MASAQFTDVFVPGGFPHHTYNPRLALQLESRLEQVRHNLCKLVTVTGHTKSGKTVLVRKVLPREEAVWVDGGTVGAEDDFWQVVLDQLDLFQTAGVEEANQDGAEVSGTLAAKASLLILKGEGQLGGKLGSTRSRTRAQSRTISSRVAALNGLRDAKRPLIVDDFHYLPKSLQGDLVRALKPLIFDGLGVAIIAIPHRRYDAIRVEKEMTGRILPVEIPTWAEDELGFIPKTGFRLLERDADPDVICRLANEAIGSPHLTQDFCRGICRAKSSDGVSLPNPMAITAPDIEQVFRDAAETIGRPIFEKLARGPRQRTDRIARPLRDGQEVDIYGLVLHAMAQLRPGLVTLEYEDLRSAIRTVSAQQIPQLHEVARVLKHMSDIAASDQSSTPVIDFDEEAKLLHITDPFFAFYLRWGKLEG
ncbi:MAG: hypothetical protein ABSG86_11890 [Thermoguttaceae bacterium]